MVDVEDGVRAEGHGDEVLDVSEGQAAEDGDAERVEVVTEGVKDRPSPILVAGELVDAPEGNADDAVERSGVPQLR